MSTDSQIRQRLLELVYDLLPEAEAAELRQRIDADGELARAYAEAQATAGLLAEAARLSVPRIELSPPEKAMSTASDTSRPQGVPRANGLVRPPRVRWPSWAAMAGAVLLCVLPSVGSYWWHAREVGRIAGGYLRLMVTGPATLPAGLDAMYTVRTSAIGGAALPAEIELALYSPDGGQLHNQRAKTDPDGRLDVSIPAEVEVPTGARLEVRAIRGDLEEPVETRLAVQPERHVTHLALDKPLYRPGETVYYRSLTLSRFGLSADREMAIEFEILDPSGAVVPGSQLQGVTERGVGNGAFVIPPEAAGGEYVLVARTPSDAFPEERQSFFVRRYRLPQLKKELEFIRDSYTPGQQVEADFIARRADGNPAGGAGLSVIATLDGQEVFRQDAQADQSGAYRVKFDLPAKIARGNGQLAVVVDDGGNRETIAKTIPINLGKVEVTFYPEGGELVAGLENRVYFVGRDPLGEPVHVEGTIVDAGGKEVAAVETMHEGMGRFSFTPEAGGEYRLKITTPADVADEPKLPSVSTDQKLVLSTGSGVFAAGEPLEFNVRAARAGIPLVAGAFCRGVPVGQQALVTAVDQQKGTGPNPVAIPVPDDAGGVIRLTVYDYSTSPPKPVAERLVYRRMARGLNVRAAGHSQAYSPGEHVQMSLQVTDEKGQPVPAVLGVSVVDDSLLNLADDDTPSMSTHLLLASEVEKPEDLEDADFYLSDDPEAAVALDLLLGTQGWRRFVERTLAELQEAGPQGEQLARLVGLGGVSEPPAVFDNLGQIESSYQEDLADSRAQWSRGMDALLTLSFLGGLALLLLVAMMGLMRVVWGVHFWVPAVGVAACCAAIAAVLVDPAGLRSDTRTAIAFAPFHVEPPEPTELAAVPDDGLEKAGLGGLEPHLAEVMKILADILNLSEEDAVRLAPLVAAASPAMMAPGVAAWAEKLADLDADKEAHMGRRDEFGLGMAADELRVLDREQMGQAQPAGRPTPFIVRQYAHQHSAGEPGVRTDFTETVFWHPMLLADADGRAEIAFDLSDSTGTFRLRADAHGAGRIGSGDDQIVSRMPFSLQPKLPLEVSAGDRIDLPLAVINDSDDSLPVRLRLDHGDLVTLEGAADRDLVLAAAGRAREYYALQVTGQKGQCELTFRGTAGPLADAVSRPLVVVPPGFPQELSHSGQLEGTQELTVELPDYWVPGSLEVTLNAYPSMLANLEHGLDSILREPNGCFEQASTANYPNILVMQYMDEHDVADPAATRRAKDLLKQGYARLVGYECSQKGYEWFGGDPGHEALTAYGLMEFRDMAGVYEVDPQMLDRTARWLMGRRDGQGGFKRNERALDSFGRAPEEITDAYITWALAESGQEGIQAEVKHAVELASASDDPYLIALAAAGALSTKREDEGRPLLGKLADAQADDGHLEGKQGSITRSGGQSLAVETTALAALAWLKSPAFTAQANRAVRWIVENRQGSGGFGSTQATILALKALVEHAKASRQTLAAGTLTVKRDTVEIGQFAFEAGRHETILIDGLETRLEPGENRLAINLTGENKLPYALDVRFRTRKPASDENCPVRLTTRLAHETVKAGETVALTAELVNATGEGQPMTIAILGLPAGLEARPDQLEELKKSGAIDYYETRAREVICYWRSLAPSRQVDLRLELVAAVPGRYVGPASRAYLYYTSEQRQWADPLQIEISRE